MATLKAEADGGCAPQAGPAEGSRGVGARTWLAYGSLGAAVVLCPCHSPLYAALFAGLAGSVALGLTLGVLAAGLAAATLLGLWLAVRRLARRATASQALPATAQAGLLRTGGFADPGAVHEYLHPGAVHEYQGQAAADCCR